MSAFSKSRTPRFVVISILTHVAIAMGVIHYGIQKNGFAPSSGGGSNSSEFGSGGQTQIEIETVSDSGAGPSAETEPTSAAASNQQNQAAEEVQIAASKEQKNNAPEPAVETLPDDEKSAVAMVQQQEQKSSVPVPAPAPAKRETRNHKAASLPKKSTPAQVTPTEVSEQMETPVVAAPAVEGAPASHESDLVDDSPKIVSVPSSLPTNEKKAPDVSDVQNELNQQTTQELESHDAALAAIEKETEAESQRLLQAQKAARLAREKPTQEAAQLKAKEETGDEAPTAAENQTNEKSIPALDMSEEPGSGSKAHGGVLAGTSSSDSSGHGGSSGAGSGLGAAPASGEMRGIEDLRPMPGNKRPEYDAEDRLKGRQGEVAFAAYVTKDGKLVQFEILRSSGHRELDAKTLKALRNWKFYPGQEGWVEIPFKWDLKGGPQEMPLQLRRRAQVSQQ